MKLSLEQQYMLSVLNSECHACWCPVDFISYAISSIDPQSRNIPSPASEELKLYNVDVITHKCSKFNDSLAKPQFNVDIILHIPMPMLRWG